MSVSLLLTGCGGEAMPTVVLPEIDTTNPLLAEWDTPHQTPPFDQIKLEHYKPAFQTAIAVSRAEVEAIVNNPAKPTFANTIVALEKQGELLNRIGGVFFNINEAEQWDICLESEFDSLDDVKLYAAHPAHVAAAGILKDAKQDRACVDYVY